MNERRELCPYCSRPLMKSRRFKFQMGEWRCAHCGAPWTGSLDLDDIEDPEAEGETKDSPVEAEADGDESTVTATNQPD
ncbi:MAG: hypothetical protein P1S60_09425 [Anaerolineae bacterium]|nr:hypothetical protein [Anaerolineae bacterium]